MFITVSGTWEGGAGLGETCVEFVCGMPEMKHLVDRYLITKLRKRDRVRGKSCGSFKVILDP